ALLTRAGPIAQEPAPETSSSSGCTGPYRYLVSRETERGCALPAVHVLRDTSQRCPQVSSLVEPTLPTKVQAPAESPKVAVQEAVSPPERGSRPLVAGGSQRQWRPAAAPSDAPAMG